MAIDTLIHYFPDLTSRQQEQYLQLAAHFTEWNRKINLVSRKDIENLEIHHILFSLAIARCFLFRPRSRILDAGTGGGFPGLPLAIFFPEVHFTLADSIAKKIRAVESIAGSLGMTNVTPLCSRVEALTETFDFVTGRAVTSLPALIKTVKGKIRSESRNPFPNGILYLKGGDFLDELSKIPASSKIYSLAEYFTEPFFETKKLIYIYGNELIRK